MSTTLIHLMKLATANDVMITFRPTMDKDCGCIRMRSVDLDPEKVRSIERRFDYRAFSGLIAADEISMREMMIALNELVRGCGRKLVVPA